MPKRRVHSDEIGLFVVVDEGTYRPWPSEYGRGYFTKPSSPADPSAFSAGEMVNAYHISGTMMVSVRRPGDRATVEHWWKGHAEDGDKWAQEQAKARMIIERARASK